jgi:levanase
MVAIYTSARPGSQAQSLAYSTDRGRTWTKYAGNPVLDIKSGEFRDPKVFWYAPQRKWVMAVSKALEHKIQLYSSPDLKTWTHMSDFGPANAVGGAWECPDLFPLTVDGTARKTKWVMLVNLNPGGIAGGSGAQYFVGDFDGTRFRADNQLGHYDPPAGTLYEGFEGTDYDGWTTTGDAFGAGPAQGNVPPQGGVAGYLGSGLANSFHGEDRGAGTLTSPTFTIARPYLNFLVGGGNHPHDPTTVDAPPPPGTVFADFEGDTYGAGWTATGTFAGTRPPAGTIGDQQPVSGYEGSQLVNTFIDHDNGTGHITSPQFTIGTDYINFLVGGGNHPHPGSTANPPTAVNLIVDGSVVRTTTGQDGEALNWTNWDVSEFKGKTARIDIVDENTGGWGHINADHFTFSDQPAFPRSNETAVNLLVDGQVVRTTTGPNSETLDWRSWNLRDLIGKTAQIQLVDKNTGGWGHILADNFAFADQPALSVLQRSSWMDYGKDYYAAVTYNDVPDGRRIAIGWMSNWNYAGATPTNPWRSATSVPRELGLRTIDGRTQLVSQPVRELRSLRSWWPSYHQRHRTIPQGTTTLPARGTALEIDADLRLAGAKRAGLKVRTGNGQETVIGYDAESAELYVDRTRSGESGFSRDFPGVQRAPLAARNGKVHLHILIDWSSVEVFADEGQTVITDQIFPAADSDGVQLFADGGNARVDSLAIWPLRSSWTRDHDDDRHDAH